VLAHSEISFFRLLISSISPEATFALKSFSLFASLGSLLCTSLHSLMQVSMYLAILLKSSSPSPRLVMAGAPIRMPMGVRADLSPGVVFLLHAMFTFSRTASTRAPSRLCGFRSRRTMWLSVPSVTSLYPSSLKLTSSALAFLMTCSWYCLNSGVWACFSATANAVIVWLWGPPWWPGKTEKLMGPSRS